MRIAAFIFFLVLISLDLPGQQDSLFGEKNTLRFARHLYNNNLFELAAQEYERLVFLNPENKMYHRELLASYRKSLNIEFLIKKSKSQFLHDPSIRLEYAIGNIADGNLSYAKEIISGYDYSQNGALNPVSKDIENSISLLENRTLIYKDGLNPVIDNFSVMYKETKTKSPLVAGVLSTIVPGTGRLYTKDYTNGILSLLFIGGSVWQSYSRFNKDGVKSVSGWVYGGLAMGFYLGNIFGSVKSAKKYNQNKYKLIDAKTKSYIINIDF